MLATLILLSYARILSTVITMLSVTQLQWVSAKHGLWTLDWTHGLDSGPRYGLYALVTVKPRPPYQYIIGHAH